MIVKPSLGALIQTEICYRDSSRASFSPLGEDHAVEYYFASDASAVVEHTNRVIYLEVSAVQGHLS